MNCLGNSDVCKIDGAIAQLGERLPCTQEVSGSIPLSSTIFSISLKLNYLKADLRVVFKILLFKNLETS